MRSGPDLFGATAKIRWGYYSGDGTRFHEIVQ